MRPRLWLAGLVVLLTSACTSQPAVLDPSAVIVPTGDSTAAPITAEQRGQVVFFGEGTCISCHSITGASDRLGPDLKGFAARIAATKPEVDVEAYIYESIVDVMAVVDPPWRGDLMPQNYAEQLSEEQIANLVAYLLVLE